MQPYPRAPDLVWPGRLHGTGCLSARAMDTGFSYCCVALAFGSGLWLGLGLGCAPPLLAGVLGCVCASGLFRLYPAIPGWGSRRKCVCLGSGFGCAPPLLAGVSGFVCACVRAPLAARHSWLGCAAWVCVFGLRFRLRPPTPGWGGAVCVCWCACSPCTRPLLAAVCGVGVCVWAGVSAAPRHSWLGCWGVCVCVRAPLVPRHSWLGCAAWVCVFGFGFPLHPAIPCWRVGVCVCWCARSACTPPLLAGVCGVGVGVWAPVSAAPRHSWLGCAAWVCVFGLGLWLRPASPGWGCGLCVCWCACSPCTPPLLAGVCGVGMGAWARVSVAPHHSWLGCWHVCVLVFALHLYPATPGWGVHCGCVCLGSGFGCAPPLLAGVLGCACLFACSPCTPPLLAGARGVGVFVRARVSAAPRHSWLGCRGVCVLMWALPLYPATPGWGVRCGCVCLGSGFGCAPPLLAGLLGCAC